MASTRQPAPPRCRIRLGQEERSLGDSPTQLLYLLAGVKSALPPVYSPGAEGAAGFRPPPLFSGEGRRVLQCGQHWEDGVPRTRLLLGKKPTSYRKCFLNTSAMHSKGYPSPAPRVYGCYYRPWELTAIGRAWPALGDGCSEAPAVGGCSAGQPCSRPVPSDPLGPTPGKSRVPWK